LIMTTRYLDPRHTLNPGTGPTAGSNPARTGPSSATSHIRGHVPLGSSSAATITSCLAALTWLRLCVSRV
jgi:hypothetical protein